MSDYISRKAAVKIAEKYGLGNGSVLGRHTGLADCIAIEIEGLPAADVEPVVRCRECRYHAASGATTSFCIHPGGMKFTSDSDYCSRGQRKNQSADVRNMGQFAGCGKTGGQNDADQH